MQQLKERGIYTLPSERGDLVAHAVFRGGYVLYTATDWEFFGPYTYESDRAGNIRREGESTHWHLDDLAAPVGFLPLVTNLSMDHASYAIRK